MIPKKIHYCWLSNDPMPTKIKKCIESWKKFLPDYELILWDFNRFPKGKSKWVDQAFEAHKYAFAADYIRAYALSTDGGIYLDSDVEVLKSFDSLLTTPYFIGREIESPIEAAVMGSTKGHRLFSLLLDYYDSREFIDSNGEMSLTPMPYVMENIIKTYFTLHDVKSPNEITISDNNIFILPADYFSPKSYLDGKITLTDNTYSIHHFEASWLTKKDKFINRLTRLLGKQTMQKLFELKHKIFG